MKRAGNLYQDILEFSNIRIACWKAMKGKHTKMDVLLYSRNLEKNLKKLRLQLFQGTFPIGNYHYFKITDPKERTICAASFPERILHHAVMNICEPFFEKYQIYDSYACRKNKGTHSAVLRAFSFSKKKSCFLKMDMQKYFDSIDHILLKKRLLKLFKDKDLLLLYSEIIDSYETSPGKGIPIGNLTSQYFANYYLSSMDHFIKEDLKTKHYIRYMDDIVLWDNSIEALKQKEKRIIHFLKNQLKLESHPPVFGKVRHGVPFLGYLIKDQGIYLLRKSRKRFIKKFRMYHYLYKKGDLDQEQLSSHIQPLVAYTSIARSRSFRKNVIKRYCPQALTG